VPIPTLRRVDARKGSAVEARAAASVFKKLLRVIEIICIVRSCRRPNFH
jgi:hypothetical protein